MDAVLLGARIVLVVVFTTAGAAKLFDLSGSRGALAGFGVPTRLIPSAAILLPLAELGIAVALVPPTTAQWGALGALLLLITFMAGIANAWREGNAPDCHCFGQIHSAPAGRSTLVRNAALAGVATFVVAGGPGPSVGAWVSDRLEAELVAVGALAGALGLAAVSLQLWRERRDLREELAQARGTVSALPRGLPVGSLAPSFELSDLKGDVHTLESLLARGNPSAIVFVSPDCGPCVLVFRELGRWQATLADRLTLAVVSSGEIAANVALAEEHGLTNVLVQEGMEVMSAYRVNATPSAVIVNADGTIASSVVSSVVSIEPLIRLTLERAGAPATEPPMSPGRV